MADALDLTFKATVGAMVMAAATGAIREIGVAGTRGDGKTIAALGAMVVHAKLHAERGFRLPVQWIGVADTFASHESKTHDSLRDDLWQGCWTIRDAGHLAEFTLNGTTLVRLRLMGVEDAGALDRVRTQCHGVWFEEPAPAAVGIQSSGLSETAWTLAMTSQRLPSHAHPAIATFNYPDEEHWTWQRFHDQDCPDECERTTERVTATLEDGSTRVVETRNGCSHRALFQVPPGELASAADRKEWARALVNRPDMLRRLIEGRPGSPLLGQQVAIGFNADVHVRPTGEPDSSMPLYFGVDGGESHRWTTVIGQRTGGRVKVYAAIHSPESGALQHLEEDVLPWLKEHAAWALRDRGSVRVFYDQACDTEDPGNRDSNPLHTMTRLLPGRYEKGPVTWPGRLNPIYALFNAMAGGRPILEIDKPFCKGLIRALDGGWYLATGADGKVRKDTPKKPNPPHEDYGDAFCYFVAGLNPLAAPRKTGPRGESKVSFDVFRVGERTRDRNPSRTDFSVFR